jgi:hypothetical protein
MTLEAALHNGKDVIGGNLRLSLYRRWTGPVDQASNSGRCYCENCAITQASPHPSVGLFHTCLLPLLSSVDNPVACPKVYTFAGPDALWNGTEIRISSAPVLEENSKGKLGGSNLRIFNGFVAVSETDSGPS